MSRGKRGTEFFCFAIPLINGVYAVVIEVAIVGFLVGVLALAPPSIVAGLGVIPSFSKDIVAALGFITFLWQIVGIVAIKREATKLYHGYVRVTTLLTLLTLLATIAFTVVAAVQHDKAQAACNAQYGAVPKTSRGSSSSSNTSVNQNYGDQICNYFIWAQVGTMGGLVVLLGLTQLYTLWCLRAYGVAQRTAARDYKMGMSASAFSSAPEDEIPLSARSAVPGHYETYDTRTGDEYSPAGYSTPTNGGILQKPSNEPTTVESGWSAYGHPSGHPSYNGGDHHDTPAYQSYPAYESNNERRNW